MATLHIPEGGFWPVPPIPQPYICPMEWRVETIKLADIYEKSKRSRASGARASSSCR